MKPEERVDSFYVAGRYCLNLAMEEAEFQVWDARRWMESVCLLYIDPSAEAIKACGRPGGQGR